ncbi:MAG TPA: ABC transporter permease [Propionicimonas sp.]|jgi:predicted permease
MQTLLVDARFALRLLWKSPGFTLTAVCSLAIALAAGTAVFSLADALLFRPRAGIADAERMVDVGRTQHGGGFDTISYPNYLDYRRASAFSGVAAYRVEPLPLSLDARGAVDRVFGMLVTANYFSVLGVRASTGRTFRDDEDRPAEPRPVAVISQRLWRERFDSAPSIVGTVVRLNNQPLTIVGVAPREFTSTTVLAPDVWIPLPMQSALFGTPSDLFTSRRSVWLMAFARLNVGVTIEQAQVRMTTLSAQLERDYPDDNRGKGIRLASSHRLPGPLRAPVTAFMAALAGLVAMVLLIACANVAGMLLARAASRRREIALRLAVGAGRFRVVRQLVTETLVLFVLSGLAGALGARWLVSLLQAALPSLPVPVLLDLRVDLRVLAFGLVLSLATGLLFGLLPALQASRPDLAPLLKSGPIGPNRSRLPVRSLFVTGQVAIALLLLVSAGLFVRALQHAAAIDPGFRTANIDAVDLDLRMGGYDERTGVEFARTFIERLSAEPGVASVSLAGVLPLGGDGLSFGNVRVPGRDGATPGDRGLEADWNVVTADYFRTLEIPLLRGRGFQSAEGSATSRVAVVNETMASRLWPGEDPIGRTFEVVGPTGTDKTLQVVGVARDAKYRWLSDSGRLFVYVPFGQQRYERQTLLIRSSTGVSSLPVVRRVLRGLNAALPIVRATTLDSSVGVGLLPQRLAASVAGALGLVGLLLAAIGIAGVTSYAAAERRKEMGIRAALGAGRGEVTRLLVWNGFRLAVVGSVVGLLAALAVTRLFSSLLLGVGAVDPVAFAGASGLFVGVALVASLLPAGMAAARDPVEALRAD